MAQTLGYFRYTDLASLIAILSRKALTVLSPDSWDDQNDRDYLRMYKEQCGLSSVLALCFTQASETYHHWRVFAPTSAGVCIRFVGTALEFAVDQVTGAQLRPVQYKKIRELRMASIDARRLPFLKRHPFAPEKEARLLWESSTQSVESLPIAIDISAISEVRLSPWLHPTLVDDVRGLLRRIDGCGSLRIYRSTLVSNVEWLSLGRSAC